MTDLIQALAGAIWFKTEYGDGDGYGAYGNAYGSGNSVGYGYGYTNGLGYGTGNGNAYGNGEDYGYD